MTLTTISVNDMHCAACINKIRKALDFDRVAATYFNPARRQVLVEHDDDADVVDLLRKIEDAGFHPLLNERRRHSHQQKQLLKRLGVAGLAMMQVMMAAVAMYAGAFDGMEPVYRRLLELASLAFCVPVVTYAAVPFFRNAFTGLRTGISMDLPISVAILAAFGISLTSTLSGRGEIYYDSVVMFTFLLLTARYIDNRLRERFVQSSERLAALPAFGTRLKDGTHEQASLADIIVGDELWVATGDQVPIDGELTSDQATLDESILTGESVWVAKRAHDPIYAGTINQGTGFALRTTQLFDRSRICDIAALADRAQSDNPPIAQVADRIAKHFVPAILAVSALTWLLWQAIDASRAVPAALAVLVVSCPCALSLATPAALAAAMTRLRQAGVVLTKSSVLEIIPKLSHALIDKTGTLTVPDLELSAIHHLDSAYDKATCLDVAAALQQLSNHPLARAFPTPRDVRITAPELVPGAGVCGSWNGHRVQIGSAAFCELPGAADRDTHLTIDGVHAMRFEISDSLRTDAKSAIDALKDEGLPVTMLSGDAEARCASLAKELEISYVARQDPETKLAVTRELQRAGERVLVVGDGVNDVPALAAADISVAVLESSDTVKAKADVLLLTRKLNGLVQLVQVGGKARRVIVENLGWALAYNAIAIPTAAVGLMPPWVAALGMASSSILVMLNATRLLGWRETSTEEL